MMRATGGMGTVTVLPGREAEGRAASVYHCRVAAARCEGKRHRGEVQGHGGLLLSSQKRCEQVLEGL